MTSSEIKKECKRRGLDYVRVRKCVRGLLRHYFIVKNGQMYTFGLGTTGQVTLSFDQLVERRMKRLCAMG